MSSWPAWPPPIPRRAAVERAARLRTVLSDLVEADAQAFDAVMAAYRLPKTTPEEQARRREAVQRALIAASEVPLQVSAHAVEVLQTAAGLVDRANPSVISDLGVAALLAETGASGAGFNVMINARSIKDAATVAALRARAAEAETAARRLRDAVVQAVARRLAAAVGVAEALRRVSGAEVGLKWPNDLVLHGRKVGGLLVESVPPWAVLGIGVNVNVDRALFPAEIRAVAISLAEAVGAGVDRRGSPPAA